MRTDIYDRVTQKIIHDLEAGIRPWHRPWNPSHAAGRIMLPLRHNGQPYHGINILMLWCAADEKGYSSPIWMTFKQALELGARVRKGEQGSPVVYASTLTRAETDEASGEETSHEIPYLKSYTVFNVDQIDGLPAQYDPPAPADLQPVQRNADADAYFHALGATIRHCGTQAYYSMSSDHVQMPPMETFRDPESYYATLAHELTHWTRHPSRLDRDFGRKRWGDEGYAMEELVAELGAAFLCASLQLTTETPRDHAGYIGSWIKVLKDDHRAIFAAAAHAQRAADYLDKLQQAREESAAA
jgi:antirestriction protein ArdC